MKGAIVTKPKYYGVLSTVAQYLPFSYILAHWHALIGHILGLDTKSGTLETKQSEVYHSHKNNDAYSIHQQISKFYTGCHRAVTVLWQYYNILQHITVTHYHMIMVTY